MKTARRMMVALAAVGTLVSAGFGESVSATAAAIDVDTRGLGEWYASGGDSIAYAPWYASDGDGLKVRLAKVYLDDVRAAVTNEIGVYDVGASGVEALSLGSGEPNRVKLIHEVLNGDGEVVASLERQVSVSTASGAASGGVWCDTRTNSVKILAEAKSALPITYSTKWFSDLEPASVRVDLVHSRMRGGTLIECTTSTVHTASAPAEGVVAGYCLDTREGGTFRFLCTALDGEGEALGTPLSASAYWKEVFGLMLLVK